MSNHGQTIEVKSEWHVLQPPSTVTVTLVSTRPNHGEKTRSAVPTSAPLAICVQNMSQLHQDELKTAIQAVILASQICRQVQSTISTDALEKTDKSPVTIADYASQAVICKLIHDRFPGDPIVGEEDAADLRKPENQAFRERILTQIQESGISATIEDVLAWVDSGDHNGTSDRYWTLDPIDGTKGFLRKEQFAVSLALLINKRIEVAVLGCPNLPIGDTRGVVFYAVRGQSAWMIPLDQPGAVPQQVRVSSITKIQQARMCESVEAGHSSHDQSTVLIEKLGISAAPVRMDSQAKYGTVARGDAEIYLRLPTRKGYEERIWDHAGGVLVVEEAGGRVTDIDGKSLDFAAGSTLKNNRGVVVTNGLLHEAVIAAIRTHFVQP